MTYEIFAPVLWIGIGFILAFVVVGWLDGIPLAPPDQQDGPHNRKDRP